MAIYREELAQYKELKKNYLSSLTEEKRIQLIEEQRLKRNQKAKNRKAKVIFDMSVKPWSMLCIQKVIGYEYLIMSSEHYIMGRAVAPRPGPKWLQMGLNQNLNKKTFQEVFKFFLYAKN